MSLYIPGINLPPNCNYCLCRSDTSRYCNAAHEYTPMSGKPDWCPLIEVPPHGRLVDADALDTKFLQAGFSEAITRGKSMITYGRARQYVHGAPTIIPADGADKEEP